MRQGGIVSLLHNISLNQRIPSPSFSTHPHVTARNEYSGNAGDGRYALFTQTAYSSNRNNNTVGKSNSHPVAVATSDALPHLTVQLATTINVCLPVRLLTTRIWLDNKTAIHRSHTVHRPPTSLSSGFYDGCLLSIIIFFGRVPTAVCYTYHGPLHCCYYIYVVTLLLLHPTLFWPYTFECFWLLL